MAGDVGPIVDVHGDDLEFIRGLITALVAEDYHVRLVRVWIDPIDRALKLKINNSPWTPPLGTLEAEEGTQ